MAFFNLYFFKNDEKVKKLLFNYCGGQLKIFVSIDFLFYVL